MTQWLFDSVGSPIAFIANDHYVFHMSGDCIGKIVGGKVWNRDYVGDIVGDRLFYNLLKVKDAIQVTLSVSRPGIPKSPPAKAKVRIPQGYRDVYLDEI